MYSGLVDRAVVCCCCGQHRVAGTLNALALPWMTRLNMGTGKLASSARAWAYSHYHLGQLETGPGPDMPTVFEKLNLKDQREILVLNAPASFEPALAALTGVCVWRKAQDLKVIHFALAFATEQAEVDRLARALAKKAPGDPLLWFAYPKGSSKKYRCAFNRDTGWDVLKSLGFDTVRAVAIDEDWSALRFRRVECIGGR